ncbi:MAG: rRNA maturation RNase YbeY [Flavisolibacter sp.]|nr:rRNA maturation RNase YbeY [Flavisolibacter sp.]
MPLKPENKIQFHYITKPFSFTNRIRLKYFLIDLFKKERKDVSHINFIFSNDDYLLQINQHYLKHNTYTDIITFELSDKGDPLIADIYISIERVKENAVTFETPFYKELLRVIFHGALHLCGYKDKTVNEKELMIEKENYYLNLFAFSRETAAR